MTLDSPRLPSPISHRRPGRLPDLLAARGHQRDPPKCHISRSYNMKWHAMDHGIPDMEDAITYHDWGRFGKPPIKMVMKGIYHWIYQMNIMGIGNMEVS